MMTLHFYMNIFENINKTSPHVLRTPITNWVTQSYYSLFNMCVFLNNHLCMSFILLNEFPLVQMDELMKR